MELRADKTKLQVFSNKYSDLEAYYAKVVNPVNIDGKSIPFVDETEHVGILRSTSSNLPHISGRISAHRKALLAVLPLGLSRGHHGNPAASLRINQIFATPVLFSGLGSLILSAVETNMLDKYLKNVTQNLQRLMDRTPACVVAFLGGTLPGAALLHLKQLSIFGMITRQRGSHLYVYGIQVLSSSRPSLNSWFQQIRSLCLLYQLPHPIVLLQESITKERFDKLVKSKVINHWELKLREAAADLSSIPYFKPEFMSLTKPHPLWTSCGSNPFESHKAVTSCRMISGRYLTDKLQSHWTQNRSGYCLLPNCVPGSVGSLEHLLLHCTALSSTRAKLLKLCTNVAQESTHLFTIISNILQSDNELLMMQFILDSSVLPEVIRTTQQFGTCVRDRLMYIGRSWCYSIHRERMRQLGLFKFI